MKATLKYFIFTTIDLLLIPFSFIFLPLLKLIRRFGVNNFPLHRKVFLKLGVFPIRNHYYDPQFVFSSEFDPAKKRQLYIDFREKIQLEHLTNLLHTEELRQFQRDGNPRGNSFYINNPAFGPGDADFYYLMIRNRKPKRIIEIGSGFSTLVALEAIKKNQQEGFETKLTCVEPFEMPWLTAIANIELVRKPVETLDPSYFTVLEENDILFIDSSHIIRPEHDVLFEYLQLLPMLQKGVLVHIHDIFSPRDYRKDWLQNEFRFWNEQYLLEAFLYYNDHFRVIGSLNYLKQDYFDVVSKIFPHLTRESEPASFWLEKVY